MKKTTLALIASALVLVGCGSDDSVPPSLRGVEHPLATTSPDDIRDTYDYQVFEIAFNMESDADQFRMCADYFRYPDEVMEVLSDLDLNPVAVEAFLTDECITGN